MTNSNRILIVDDDLMVGLHIKVEVEAMGYSVIGPVSSVEGARAVLRDEDETVAVAILDVNLHHENSLTLAQDLWERRIPFIFVTGSRLGLMQRQFPQVAILPKPVDFRALQQQLASICEENNGRNDMVRHSAAG